MPLGSPPASSGRPCNICARSLLLLRGRRRFAKEWANQRQLLLRVGHAPSNYGARPLPVRFPSVEAAAGMWHLLSAHSRARLEIAVLMGNPLGVAERVQAHESQRDRGAWRS